MSATQEPDGVAAGTPASRLAAYVRGGGVVVPLLTTFLAFIAGGLVMLVTGSDPIATYEAIWKGTGLQWIFPWVTGDDRELAAANLQQTLIIHAADPHRTSGGIRVPSRSVQHRR